MQTIITKYLGPTNHRGSRYKATHTGNFTSVTLNADYSMNAEANHVEAALALAEKLGWEGDYTGGHTQDGMVFVNSDGGYCFRSFGKKAAA